MERETLITTDHDKHSEGKECSILMVSIMKGSK